MVLSPFIARRGTACNNRRGKFLHTDRRARFGKKKSTPAPTPPEVNREIYGMPAFEYESYEYGLYKNKIGIEGSALGSITGNRIMEMAAMDPGNFAMWWNIGHPGYAGSSIGSRAAMSMADPSSRGYDPRITSAYNAWLGAGTPGNPTKQTMGYVVININGGDTDKIKTAVSQALAEQFGPVASARIVLG